MATLHEVKIVIEDEFSNFYKFTYNCENEVVEIDYDADGMTLDALETLRSIQFDKIDMENFT